MRNVFKSCLIALIGVLGTATSSEARPAGVPSQRCSDISRPRPGTLCYVLHDNQGGKAEARSSPNGGELIIQPQSGYYVVDSTAIEVTSQAGNGKHDKKILSVGASLDSASGYRSKLEELDRVINELEGKVVGTSGNAVFEAKNKLTYLRERRAEYAEYYQTAASAGRDAPKTQYTWSASSRSCGIGGFDKCGSWFNFKVYEVRRYLGDPIAEYNAQIVPAINQARAAVQNISTTQPSGNYLVCITNKTNVLVDYRMNWSNESQQFQIGLKPKETWRHWRENSTASVKFTFNSGGNNKTYNLPAGATSNTSDCNSGKRYWVDFENPSKNSFGIFSTP